MRPSATVSRAGMRLHITRIGWPQAHRQAARIGVVGMLAMGAARRCSTRSNRMAFALLGCRKPKLRERRRPWANRAWLIGWVWGPSAPPAPAPGADPASAPGCGSHLAWR